MLRKSWRKRRLRRRRDDLFTSFRSKIISAIPMLFFDFLNYKIAKFYGSFGEKGAASTSAAIIGGLQAMNVMTIAMLIWANMNKLFVVILFVIFQVTIYMRYLYRDKYSVTAMEIKWLNKSISSKKRITAFMFLYVSVSFLSCVGTAIYLAGQK